LGLIQLEMAFRVLHFLALLSGIFFKVSFCCFYDQNIAYLSSGYACILDIVCLTCEIYAWRLGIGWTTSITHCWHGKNHLPSPWSTYCNWSIFDMEKYGLLVRGDWILTWRDFDN
jgi:hypothetical protein